MINSLELAKLSRPFAKYDFASHNQSLSYHAPKIKKIYILLDGQFCLKFGIVDHFYR